MNKPFFKKKKAVVLNDTAAIVVDPNYCISTKSLSRSPKGVEDSSALKSLTEQQNLKSIKSFGMAGATISSHTK